MLQSDRPPARGRPAIQAAYEGQGGGQLQLRALAFAAGDTAGYIIGAYWYGKASSDIGKFTLILRRSRGKPARCRASTVRQFGSSLVQAEAKTVGRRTVSEPAETGFLWAWLVCSPAQFTDTIERAA